MTTILLNNKPITTDHEFWSEFNWQVFESGDTVFTEDTDSVKDLAVVFSSYENGTVKLERRSKHWQQMVCSRTF